uniref:Uncharacterized protein n=1 Tax=Cacopsylla melanoneura TaxID=428564 RepID=A0A8D9E0R2_9HEMI
MVYSLILFKKSILAEKIDFLNQKNRVLKKSIFCKKLPSLLTQAIKLYEEKIGAYQQEEHCLRETGEHIIELVEQLPRSIREYKHALRRELDKVNKRLYREEENRLMREKIIDEKKDTVNMLSSRVEDMFCQLQMCERERDTLC